MIYAVSSPVFDGHIEVIISYLPKGWAYITQGIPCLEIVFIATDAVMCLINTSP